MTIRSALVLVVSIGLGSCASLPPGADYPRTASTALAHPEATRLGQQFGAAAHLNEPKSGFRIISAGKDGFLVRMQMVGAAEKTLDLQYFIFRGDDTGRLLTDAVVRAADRGVRVRILIDDGETVAGDEQIAALEAHPSIEIRIFNPFRYRGHFAAVRALEFAFNSSRLDYRMHNKLLVIDNAVALVGGRNIGDAYFQIDPDAQFADDDVFVVGPITRQLSGTFDEYWNDPLSVPERALSASSSSWTALSEHRELRREQDPQLKGDGIDYLKLVAAGEPFAGMVSGRLPLVWAPAVLVSDSPDKKSVSQGDRVGRLMQRPVAAAAGAVHTELLMVTPYLIPGEEGMQLFGELRRRGVRVRILTSSLEASTVSAAQSGYMHYRVPLLASGVDLYEIHALLGNTRGSGQTRAMSRHGNYALHAKLFVFDRQKLFIGSMNFDQRSMHLNTEVGLIIDSPVLAGQMAARFEAMVQPPNAYALALVPGSRRGSAAVVWRTEVDGKAAEYRREPARSTWQRTKVGFLALLPLDDEL